MWYKKQKKSSIIGGLYINFSTKMKFPYTENCDEHFNEEYEVFPSENNLIENLIIDGKPLIQIIDDLIEVEVY
jgi:hypothetical protein